MAFEKITENVENIILLPNTPAIPVEDLKKEFDKGSKTIKTKFNKLVDDLNEMNLPSFTELEEWEEEKSVELNDNTFLDSTSIVHNRTKLSDILGTVLFENSNGVNYGTNIVLSETSENFNYLEIFYARESTVNTYASVKVENPNNKQFGMSIIYPAGGATMQIYGGRMEIEGVNVNWTESMYSLIVGTSINATGRSDVIRVYKIIGYK